MGAKKEILLRTWGGRTPTGAWHSMLYKTSSGGMKAAPHDSGWFRLLAIFSRAAIKEEKKSAPLKEKKRNAFFLYISPPSRREEMDGRLSIP